MAGHGLLADAQDLADLPVCLAASDEIDAFDLSRGQRRAQMYGPATYGPKSPCRAKGGDTGRLSQYFGHRVVRAITFSHERAGSAGFAGNVNRYGETFADALLTAQRHDLLIAGTQADQVLHVRPPEAFGGQMAGAVDGIDQAQPLAFIIVGPPFRIIVKPDGPGSVAGPDMVGNGKMPEAEPGADVLDGGPKRLSALCVFNDPPELRDDPFDAHVACFRPRAMFQAAGFPRSSFPRLKVWKWGLMSSPVRALHDLGLGKRVFSIDIILFNFKIIIEFLYLTLPCVSACLRHVGAWMAYQSDG